MSRQYTHANLRVSRITWAALLLIGAGCERAPAPASAPTRVIALEIHPKPEEDGGSVAAYPVEAAPRYSTPLSFRVSGQLIERRVHLGDVVRSGQILARLDDADAVRQAAAARAALAAARHRLAYARQQLERDTAQFGQSLISAAALEQTQDAVSAAQAGATQAEAQADIARHAVAYHALLATHDGVISAEAAEVGQTLAAGQVVYALAWDGAIDVTLDAAAVDLNRIAIGQAARVTFPALPGRRFTARVREISPDGDPQTRTYRIKMTLQPAAPGVHLGMAGEAVLENAEPGPTPVAVQIPSTAVFHSGNVPAVWVIRAADSTLELRPVAIGRYSADAAIVSQGLAAGDRIVVAGVHTVFAGERVTPVQPLFGDEPAPPPAP